MLVGRREELDLLVEAATGAPSLVLVEGEAGVGKTSLINEVLASPSLSQRRRLVGRCHPTHERFAFGPLVQALRGLGEVPTDILNPVAGALRPLLPELADQLPRGPARFDDPLVMRHRVFRAFHELLEAIGPTVLVLEDLHWADPTSIEMLEFLLTDAPAELVLILTYRKEELDDVAVLSLAERVSGGVACKVVSVPALSLEEVRDLAGTILVRGTVSEQLGRDLRQRTAGIPFALKELIALLRDRKRLVCCDGRWQCDELSSVGVPAAIERSVRRRLDLLGTDARLMTEAVTVLGTPAAEEPIGRVAGLAPARARAGLSVALASGLVQEVEGGRFGLRHALAEQALYDGIPSPERRIRHLRAARALAGSPESDSLAQIAGHYRKAGRVRLWLRCAEQAAAAAASVGDDRGAARLLEEVLATPNLPVAARARVAIELGNAALFGRLPGGAIEILREIVQDPSLRPGIRGELRFCLARLLYQAGDSARGYQEMARSADELHRRPALAARAMANLATTWPTKGGAQECGCWLDRAMRAERRQHDPAVSTHVAASRAVILLEAGDPAGWQASADIPWHADCDEQAVEFVRACKYLAATATLLGYCGRAEGFIETANQIRLRLGNERFRVGLAVVECELHWITGRWQGLETRVRQLVEACDEARIMSGRTELVLGCLLLSRGELEEAERLLVATLSAFRNARPGSFLLTAVAGLVRIHLGRGDTATARVMASLALETIQAGRVWALAHAVPPVIVEALLACQEHAHANDVAAALAQGLRGRDAPAARASLAVCRGLMAEAGGHHSSAARWSLRAERAWTALPCPYEAARAREHRGACLLARQDRAGADCLFGALEQFDALGASWDAARVKALLRKHNVPLRYPWRGGHRGYGKDLSPREREVAGLAARGRTSPEIAHALVLSPRTVESHLASAMRKLGTASRRELGSALATAWLEASAHPGKVP